jgi:CPA1 family monovalent cation:H+ antiporter
MSTRVKPGLHLIFGGLILTFLLGACTPADISRISQIVEQELPFIPGVPEAGPTPEFPAGIEPGAYPPETEAAQINEDLLIIEEVIIGLLFLAVLVGMVALRLRVPYTVGLVLIGLVLALGVPQRIPQIPPNLILALLVPPLIFEAAFHLNYEELRKNLVPILVLAIPGVILTTLIVGGIVAWGTQLPIASTLVFGSLVAATDPVSVVSLFRSMGVPRRLQVLLEGESLFNDGTAIVIFDLVLISALSSVDTFHLANSVLDFALVAGGGLGVGLVCGALISSMIRGIDDHLIETTLTSVLAYGAYLVAEVMGVSGVLAVVAAGLINGNIGPRGMSPTTRIVVFNFWEYAAFLANTFIFLLIGLQIDLTALFENWILILWAIGAVLIARAVGVYGLSWIERDIPFKWRHVLYWGGLRGAISLALALSLPATLPGAEAIKVMAFGVVLFTLLIQGFSMGTLVRKMGLIERSETQDEYERRHARAVSSRVAFEHLQRRNRQGLISDHSWRMIAPLLEEHNRVLTNTVREVLTTAPSLESEELDTAHREYLRAQRSSLTALLKDGVISEENYSLLVSEVDAALIQQQTGWSELIGRRKVSHLPIDRLTAVVIQEQDSENAMSALTKLGLPVTRLPSTGGFLGRQNVTLLIGFALGQETAIVNALRQSCRQRVQYVATPIAGDPAALPTSVPVIVGGATIFTLQVERFEVF